MHIYKCTYIGDMVLRGGSNSGDEGTEEGRLRTGGKIHAFLKDSWDIKCHVFLL
jgi:hypothetical protein